MITGRLLTKIEMHQSEALQLCMAMVKCLMGNEVELPDAA